MKPAWRARRCRRCGAARLTLAEDRADVDDAARSAASSGRQGRGSDHGAGGGTPTATCQVGVLGLVDRGDAVDAGVVDEDVDRAEEFTRSRCHVFNFVAVGQFGGEPGGASACPSRIAGRAASSSGAWRATITTFAPDWASARAMDCPRPLLPPVTRALRPLRSNKLTAISDVPLGFGRPAARPVSGRKAQKTQPSEKPKGDGTLRSIRLNSKCQEPGFSSLLVAGWRQFEHRAPDGFVGAADEQPLLARSNSRELVLKIRAESGNEWCVDGRISSRLGRCDCKRNGNRKHRRQGRGRWARVPGLCDRRLGRSCLVRRDGVSASAWRLA